MATSTVSIDLDLCDNEQLCEAICPEGVFRIEDGTVIVAAPSACTLCFKCAENCPAGAIELDF